MNICLEISFYKDPCELVLGVSHILNHLECRIFCGKLFSSMKRQTTMAVLPIGLRIWGKVGEFNFQISMPGKV